MVFLPGGTEAVTRRTLPEWVDVVLLALLCAVGTLLRFHDLTLDPPWTIYTDVTDEGWWAGNAAHRNLFGTWFIPHNYNTILISPVASALFHAAFSLLGVSLCSARAASALAGILAVLLLHWAFRRFAGRFVTLLAVAFVAVSFLPVSFSRMALLDMPSLVFGLATLGFYLRILRRLDPGFRGGTWTAELLAWLPLSICLFAALLSKTSSILLISAMALHGILWIMGHWTARGDTSDDGRLEAESARSVKGQTDAAAPSGCVSARWALVTLAQGVVGLAWPLALWALVQCAFRVAWPEEWHIAFGVNIADKLTSWSEWSAALLWFLAFNQLLENSPMVIIAAWTQAFLWVSRTVRTRAANVVQDPVETLFSLWFLTAALFVASFAYQPKRYHMLMFVPACLCAATLARRLVEGVWNRRDLIVGVLGSGLVLSFSFGMTWIRAQGRFIGKIKLDPVNVGELLWVGVLIYLGVVLVVAVLVYRRERAGPAPAWQAASLAVILCCFQFWIDVRAWRLWIADSRPTVVQAAREVGETMRRDRGSVGSGLLLAGECAHTIMVEAHIPGRRIVVAPAAGVVSIPREPISHVIIDDRRDLPIFLRHVPQLASGTRLLGEWVVCPDWGMPTRWRLYGLNRSSRPPDGQPPIRRP